MISHYSSKHLSLFRIFFYSSLLIVFNPFKYIAAFQNIPTALFINIDPNPIYLLIINDANALIALVAIFYCSCVCSAIGFGSFIPRLTTAVSLILLTGLFTVPGIYHYRYAMTAIVALILIFFDMNRHYSIDSRNKNFRSQNAQIEFKLLQFAYFWLFFDAALSKWSIPNWGWFSLDKMPSSIEYTLINFYKERLLDIQNNISVWLLERPQLLRVMAILTILIETIVIIGFFYKKWTYPMVLLSIGLLLGISIFLGLNFITGALPLIMMWLPYDKIEKN